MAQPARLTAASTVFSPAWRHRIGSIVAVFPLSVWVFNHLLENLLLFRGPTAWEAQVTGATGPVQEALITIFVIGPIVLHTIWGINRMRKTRWRDAARTSPFDHVRFFLQRAAGIGVLFFLGAHLIKARILPAMDEPTGHITLQGMAANMENMPTLIVYALGVLGVAYHVANGLWGFAIHMGWYQGPRAQDRLRNTVIAFFLVLLVMGWAVLWGLVTKY